MKMEIENFEITVKKYDREKNFVIVNLLICETIEIRGFVVRYTPTKHSKNPVWLVTPPSVRGRGGKYFWIFQLKDAIMWQQLESMIVQTAKNEVNKII